MNIVLRRSCLIALAFTVVACSAQSSGSSALQTGMTPDQTVSAMGQPDLKDEVPDANHSGATDLRYTWLSAGKAAVFSADHHVASIQDIGSSPSTVAEAEQQQRKPEFDPIQTPFDYAFYPFRVAMIYIGAGLNCVGGNGCHKPQLPPPNMAG